MDGGLRRPERAALNIPDAGVMAGCHPATYARENTRSTASGMGHVHIIRDFHSPQEGISRTVRIYTPDAYAHAPHQHFPVLYMHDGQNVFAHPESARYDTWCANAAMDRLVSEGRVEPWIIVAVDHTVDRLAEYSPWDEPRSQVRARGEAYVRFLVDTLKPYVESVYRTRGGPEWTGVMGSSLGGLISLYCGWKHPELFASRGPARRARRPCRRRGSRGRRRGGRRRCRAGRPTTCRSRPSRCCRRG